MVSLKWCFKQKDGIKVVESNDNLSQSYIKMAENAIGTMNREKEYNLQFAISACYYSMYYSLYAILMKIGIKCEIHSCTLEFMEKFLNGFYSVEDIKIIKKAFNLRITAQYYADKIIDKGDVNEITEKAPLFFNKSKKSLSKINEEDIKDIKNKIRSNQ
ncbi:HEPN domain-containing protein [Candidatus Pacearchaeota archaeon]|nr:HEPN domain-containing protein [Candidatus Pacearchaeota archaeon]